MGIELSQINKSFNGRIVLSNINLNINEGETTVIVGPSGSGKSTLLRCINLLEIPESGELAIEDQKINFENKLNNKLIAGFRKKTGMVFQNFNLFPHLTVLENVIEGPVHVLQQPKELAIATAKDLLEKVGLSGKEDMHPSRLSGGMQQRVAIARALAMSPYFLLLDEPTSALDPELEAEVLKVISDLSNENKSLIIVTHNLLFARKVADRIIFLEHGEIYFDGTPELFFEGHSERIESFISAMSFNKNKKEVTINEN